MFKGLNIGTRINTKMRPIGTSPARIIIEKDRIITKNWNRPLHPGRIDPNNFEPYPKNPVLARFFVNIGFADTLGSGGRNLYRYTKIYSGKEPELIEGDIFQTIIPLNRTQDAPANVSNDVPNEEIAKSIVGHQLAEYRDAKLKKMIKHCYETVPYYTQLFNEGEVNPNSIKSLEDLRILPILTKSIVNKNPEDFISTAIPKSKMVTMHTSGTTGSSFVFQTTQEVICEQWAVWWRYRRALGIEFGTEQAMFGTQRIVPVNQHKPPYWRYNKANHQTYFSACCTSTGN